MWSKRDSSPGEPQELRGKQLNKSYAGIAEPEPPPVGFVEVAQQPRRGGIFVVARPIRIQSSIGAASPGNMSLRRSWWFLRGGSTNMPRRWRCKSRRNFIIQPGVDAHRLRRETNHKMKSTLNDKTPVRFKSFQFRIAGMPCCAFRRQCFLKFRTRLKSVIHAQTKHNLFFNVRHHFSLRLIQTISISPKHGNNSGH